MSYLLEHEKANFHINRNVDVIFVPVTKRDNKPQAPAPPNITCEIS